jgi:anti-sigma regulatory factor (Ser/Thr protein kinase)
MFADEAGAPHRDQGGDERAEGVTPAENQPGEEEQRRERRRTERDHTTRDSRRHRRRGRRASAHCAAQVHTRIDVLAVAAEARALAARSGLDGRRAEELALVIAELAMNAVLHGPGAAQVSVTVSAERWSVEVEDGGPGLSQAVLADAGLSDRLGRDGVRPPHDGHHSFGSGLAGVRRLSSRLELSNRDSGGARVVAHREFSKSSLQPQRGTSP